MHTPFFPALRAALAPGGSRTGPVLKTVRALTLCQLEDRFASCLPPSLFPKNPSKQNSRYRIYTPWRTFWCLLWQSFNPLASCREVVRQLQALFELQGGPRVCPADGAYCRARGRLPGSAFPKALAATARVADGAAPPLTLLQGRALKLVDGSTVSAPDTPENRKAYPPLHSPEPNFPMLRIVVLFSLLSGAILRVATGNLRTAELPMFAQLMSQLARGDILLGDRGFANFVTLALLANLNLGLDFIGRSARRVDGRRRLKGLGKNDWLVKWKRSSNPSLWLSPEQWQALPKELTVRIVRGSLYCKGFRVRQVTLVTTLLDSEQYPAPELLRAYLRRWRLELCLDDLKTTLEMEMLRCHSPEMVQKEIYAHLIVYNLVRWTMAQAAREHAEPLERISFKGSLDALRHFTQAMSRARSKSKRQRLWSELLQTLAEDLVPERPGRREPRAVKRVKNKYPRLSLPRHKFHDRPKRGVRRRIARMRKLGLM